MGAGSNSSIMTATVRWMRRGRRRDDEEEEGEGEGEEDG